MSLIVPDFDGTFAAAVEEISLCVHEQLLINDWENVRDRSCTQPDSMLFILENKEDIALKDGIKFKK